MQCFEAADLVTGRASDLVCINSALTVHKSLLSTGLS